MTRILTAIFFAILLLSLPACGKNAVSSRSAPPPPPPSTAAPQQSSSAPAPPEEAPSSAASASPKASSHEESPSAPAPSQSSPHPPATSEPPKPPVPPSDPMGGTGDTAPGIEGGEYLTITEAEVMTLINRERRSLDLTPLTQDPLLAKAARMRADELFRNDFFEHLRPDGSPWETILENEVPVAYSQAAENLAYRNQRPGEMIPAFQWFTMWKESPDHYAAMINPSYTHLGVGILTGPYHPGENQTYAVALFCTY